MEIIVSLRNVLSDMLSGFVIFCIIDVLFQIKRPKGNLLIQMKKKGKVLYLEVCDMLQNIKSDRSVSQNKVISANAKDKYFEEMQYAIIISRFYYAFMLIAKGEMAEDGETGKFEHSDMIKYKNQDKDTVDAFKYLRDLRNKADYELNLSDLKKKWGDFHRNKFPFLVGRYKPTS